MDQRDWVKAADPPWEPKIAVAAFIQPYWDTAALFISVMNEVCFKDDETGVTAAFSRSFETH